MGCPGTVLRDSCSSSLLLEMMPDMPKRTPLEFKGSASAELVYIWSDRPQGDLDVRCCGRHCSEFIKNYRHGVFVFEWTGADMRTLARDSVGTVGRDTGGVCECGPLVGQRGFRMGERLSKFFRKGVPFERLLRL